VSVFCLAFFQLYHYVDLFGQRWLQETGKGIWTSQADNGRKFRGKPRDKEKSSVNRQFKKPHRTGEYKVLQTNAIGGGETGDKSQAFWYTESS
jgi:hypothetical protein